MATHRAAISATKHLNTYLDRANRVLDAYKHGDISQVEALEAAVAASAALTDALSAAFLVRLRNLEAFGAPRGEVVPPAGG